jgi:hypothetical protein
MPQMRAASAAVGTRGSRSQTPFGNASRETPFRVLEFSVMTRTRYRIFEDGHPYFMTCTIVG